MTKRFAETFIADPLPIQDVFRALFGGGRAELKLTDPNDLLQSGVDIIAQPPGKKLQNLNLLVRRGTGADGDRPSILDPKSKARSVLRPG